MIDRRAFLYSLLAAGAGASMPIGLFARTLAADGPDEVLIIRHGEEPTHGPHLNDQGRQRAMELPKLFEGRYPRPTALFAPQPTAQSARSTETLGPLAAALHLTINESFAEPEVEKLAQTILTKPVYANGHVLICWHRETMVQLATALGVSNPPKWPSKQYDHIWRIRFTAKKAKLTDELQSLPGDPR